MKRKALVFLLAIMLVSITAIGMVACEKLTVGESIEGTYYSYENGSIIKSDYITLEDGKWVDSDGMDGTYKVSNGKITFYSDLFGEEVVVYEGTIKDGVIKLDVLGEDMYFCKEGKTPPNTKPDDSQQNKPNVTKYSVTYNANGGKFLDGSSTYEQNVDENTLLTAPDQPIKQGCSFAGWSKKKSSSDMWKFAEDKITEDITLYAVWTEKTASILSVDGAIIEDNSISMLVNKDTDYVSLATKVVCSSDSTWRLYYDRLGLTEIPTKIATQKTGVLNDGDNIFYIVVTSSDGTQVNTYELKIHRSYLISINYVGVYGTTIETKTTYTGYEYVVNYNPHISGYTFNYWNNENGEKTTKFIPYSSTNLYADCTVNAYTATLDVNGGNEISKTSYDINYDSNYNFPKPQRTGYTFLGWYDNSTQLTDSNGKNLTVWKFASNKKITAHWQANKYTITLSSNDSKAGTLSGGGEHSYDSNVTITANTNSGYTWLGWYDSKDNLVTSNTNYTFKMEFDKSYTAKWTYYTLTTKTNNSDAGTVTSKNNTKTTVGEKITITAQGNLGYIFEGWYKGEEKITEKASYTFTMPAENLIYIAKWSLDEKLLPFYYRVTATTLEITGLKDKTVTNIIVPNYVTKISQDAFKDCKNITTATIPTVAIDFIPKTKLEKVVINGGTSIGKYAFNGCSSLTSIEIHNSVTSIGDYAFYKCSSLTRIEIPSSVTSINGNPFWTCSNLTIFCEAESKPSGWASRWNALNSAVDLRVLWNYGGENGVTEDKIEWDLINNGTITIMGYSGEFADIVIPSAIDGHIVTSIGDWAFLGCSSITSIEIPSSVTSIGSKVFSGCGSLEDVTVDPNNTKYKSEGNCVIERATDTLILGCKNSIIPNYVTSIGYEAFSGCRSLTSISIPSSVTSIGSYAFEDCSSLTSIKIPSSVTNICSSAFSYCSSLTSIEIPSSVTSIGNSAFYGCSSLTIYSEASEKPSGWGSQWNYTNRPVVWGYNYITNDGIVYGIKDGVATVVRQSIATSGDKEIAREITYKGTTYVVTSIGSSAFYGCSSLRSIVIPNSVTSIGDWAFSGCSMLIIYCEAESQPSGWDSDWNKYSYSSNILPVVWDYKNNDIASDGNIYYIAENGIRYALKDGVATVVRQSIATSGDKEIAREITYKGTTYVVTSIGSSAFYGCSSLRSIVIPNSVTSIGYQAFQSCSSLTSIEIPSSVTSIGYFAFSGCSSLTIYSEASEKPSGWESSWNSSNRPVEWGHKISG